MIGFTMDRFGNKSVSEVREVNFKVKHLSDPGKPVNIPGLGDVLLTYNNIVMVPEQSKYINDLVIFYDDPATLGETFVFVPSLRRSIRLSSAARCSPLVGSDYTADDERSMSIQPPIFQAKFLGYKKLLVMYPTDGYYNKANYYQPAVLCHARKPPKWMLRDVARAGHSPHGEDCRGLLLRQPHGLYRQGNLAADLDGSLRRQI